jgi:hypothetical protein
MRLEIGARAMLASAVPGRCDARRFRELRR